LNHGSFSPRLSSTQRNFSPKIGLFFKLQMACVAF
jgi:hypothetical protein